MRDEASDSRRWAAKRLGLVGIAAAVLAGSFFAGSIPRPVSAQGTTYYFHGVAQDQANKVAGTPTATWSVTAPTGSSDVLQTGPPVANIAQSENPLTIYWVSTSLTGTLNGDIHLDWWWSVSNPSDLAFQDQVDVNVFADVTGTGTGTKIGGATGLSITPSVTPTESTNDVAINGTATTNVVIEATQHFINGGMTNTVHYDSTTAPSSFIFPYVPPSGGMPPTVTTGPQVFANYDSPPGYQNLDGAQRQNAGEPSIGSDWNTGNIMYMAGTQVSQIHFDTSKVPPAPTWTDVTPTQLANASEDSILFTDHAFIGATPDRTWAEDFLVSTFCDNMAYTDTDGSPPASAWSPSAACAILEGPDHPSVGAGPYSSAVAGSTYPHVLYYCSQNVVQTAGAFCAHSENGGQTFDSPSTHIFGSGTPCGAIHGHVRVAPDGTMYVPQNNCTVAGTARQGMALTQDNGNTYTYAVVPDSTARPANTGTDPSLAASSDNTLYYGYEDGTGSPNASHPLVAVSQDHGAHWTTSGDVGAPFGIQNVEFPEVIAGDGGRAAFAFLGTTTAGNSQSTAFTGVWYLYISFTYDHGKSWQTVNATPNDPVQRGCIFNGGTPSPACRNLLDFNDITVDKQGRVYVSYTDGCTTDPTNTYSCDTNPAIAPGSNDSATNPCDHSQNAAEYSTATCTYGRQSALVRQVCGEGLFAPNDPGFFEGPSCTAPVNKIPESALAGGLLVIGLVAVGVIRIRRRRRGAQIADLG